jgi:hypothetical protein
MLINSPKPSAIIVTTYTVCTVKPAKSANHGDQRKSSAHYRDVLLSYLKEQGHSIQLPNDMLLFICLALIIRFTVLVFVSLIKPITHSPFYKAVHLLVDKFITCCVEFPQLLICTHKNDNVIIQIKKKTTTNFSFHTKSLQRVSVKHLLPRSAFTNIEEVDQQCVPISKSTLSTFIARYPRVSSKRFTSTLTLLAMLPG